jgi:hypothetical protein
MPSPLARCKKMDVVAGMIEKRLNERIFLNMDCKPAKQCSGKVFWSIIFYSTSNGFAISSHYFFTFLLYSI